jgi:hypothetical protein
LFDYKIMMIGIALLLQLGCASQTYVDHFEGFPNPVEAINRDPATDPLPRLNYSGLRFSLLGLGAKPGEIQLYPYITNLRFETNRMKSMDRNFMMTLSDERHVLLEHNLYDTGVDTDRATELASKCDKLMSTPHREAEGLCYYTHFNGNLQMGSRGTRFGRNTAPTARIDTDVMSPNPRLISQELFARKNGIQKADIINVLAAAWLQAMNHDWFSHGKNLSHENPFMIPDPAFPNDTAKSMMIPRTKPDASQLNNHGYASTFRNVNTQWWDASELYGSDRKTIIEVRTHPTKGFLTDGKLAVDEVHRRLFYKADGKPLTGFADNWWSGLEMIHTLFALEHNKIVDRLTAKYPKDYINKIYFGNDTSKSFTQEQIGEWYFQKARLIVAAEMARIHTIEWTPALLDNSALHIGMYANWHGLLPLLKDIPLVGNMFSEKDKQAFMGLTGPSANMYLYNAPFTLTEEFVAVYRMHPLIPDSMQIYNQAGQKTEVISMPNMLFTKAKAISESRSALDLLLSFGVDNPGALTLNNYPEFIRNITVPGNTDDPSQMVTLDLGAVDVLRDRERRVPRYNEFRRQLGAALRQPAVAASIKQRYPNNPLPLEPIKTFEELTSNPQHLAELHKVYGNDVEKLDLIVGTLAEKDRYAGFAFGNTPFYIFAIMASRRLMVDPFFNKYYTPQVYTQEGLDWINNSKMTDVIVRNFPELKPKFQGITNAFQPWNLQSR